MKNKQFTQSNVYHSQEEEGIEQPLAQQSETVVIEQTAKRYKAMMVIGNLIGFSGVIFFFFTFSETAEKMFSNGTGITIAIVLFCLGGFINAAGKGLAWWYHG